MNLVGLFSFKEMCPLGTTKLSLALSAEWSHRGARLAHHFLSNLDIANRELPASHNKKTYIFNKIVV